MLSGAPRTASEAVEMLTVPKIGWLMEPYLVVLKRSTSETTKGRPRLRATSPPSKTPSPLASVGTSKMPGVPPGNQNTDDIFIGFGLRFPA